MANTVWRCILVTWFSCCFEYVVLQKIRVYCLSFSLDWKDRVCQTVNKYFVCLFVCLLCLSVYNPFLKPRWDLLSIDSQWRFLLRQIEQNLSFALDWSLSCFFSLARSNIEYCDALDFIASSVWKKRLWNLNSSLSFDHCFYLNGWKALYRLYVWLAACWPSSCLSKKLSWS